MPADGSRKVAGPTLHLAVQYASVHPAPRRERVRRWASAAIAMLATPAGDYRLTVRFVDLEEGAALNRGFRGKNGATNVLTFPYADAAITDSVEADIVVCLPVVEREAVEQGKDAMTHCAHLVVHGVLHAAGLDHDTDDDARAMEALEVQALMRFAIADPYRDATG